MVRRRHPAYRRRRRTARPRRTPTWSSTRTRERGTALGAFALWFLNTSTWTGTHGVYLEDLYVRPELRGSGYGKRLLQTLAQVCLDRGYRRLEWWVLDWNEPALGFYRTLGALPMDEWTVHRVTGADLVGLATGDAR